MEETGAGVFGRVADPVDGASEHLPAPDEIDAEWQLFDADVEAWSEVIAAGGDPAAHLVDPLGVGGEPADSSPIDRPIGADDPDASLVRPEHLLDLIVTEVASLTRQLERTAARRARLLERARVRAVELEEARATEREAMGLRVEAPSRRRELAHRSVSAEVACATRSPEPMVARWLADASRLADGADATLRAAESGRISFRHACTIADELSSLPAEVRGAYESAVLPIAECTTAVQFRRRARRLRERMHPDSIDERCLVATRERHVRVTGDRDGMAWLTAFLPAATAFAIDARLSDFAGTMASAEGDAGSGDSEARTTAQLRADVLADLLLDDGACGERVERDAVDDRGPETCSCRGPVGDGARRGGDAGAGAATRPDGPSARARRRGIRPTVSVTVPALTLLGRGDEPAELEGYGPVPTDAARELAGEASSWTRLLTHPERGSILSVGRERYAVPADLRTWLRVRDGTCRFPGCTTRAERCEVDHTRDWAAGGETRHDNLAHLCARHHHLKHEGGWRVESLPGGALRWRSPTGHDYATEPEQQIGEHRTDPKRAHGRSGRAKPPRGSGDPPDIWSTRPTPPMPGDEPPF